MSFLVVSLLAVSLGVKADIVDEMTLEEKVDIVVGTATAWPNPPQPAPGTFANPPQPAHFPNTYQAQGRVQGAAGESMAIARLGIPSIVFTDGPAGVRIDPARPNDKRSYRATAFPIGTLVASSWDVQLAKAVGQGIGSEAREYGSDIMLCPGMNIMRNPLCGRNYEYYSEDPLLAGRIAAGMVEGIQSEGVGTSVKHFAVNNQETFRNGINAVVSERALRELYLRPFEVVVKEAKPWTVMSSYNKINGTYASENEWLLTKVLRDEWGFMGFVMTDWWGEHDAVRQMLAGNDMLMPGTPAQKQAIILAVKEGRLPMAVLDRNVRCIINAMRLMPSWRQYKYSNAPDVKGHEALARRTAAEAMVLLKNDGVLPLTKAVRRPALFGVASYDLIAGGSGSGYVYKRHKVSTFQGLQADAVKPWQPLANRYTAYVADEQKKMPAENFWYVPLVPEMNVDDDMIARSAREADVAIITIGRSSGEGADRQASQGDYLLSDLELSLLRRTSQAFHALGKKVVVVLNIGGVIDMLSWQHEADAILLAWQPGQEGGLSIADVLTGRVNPSGRLPMTFPLHYADVPSADNFPVTAAGAHSYAPASVVYAEDLFVGYCHYTSHQVPVAYPFGFGLSYTSFQYGSFTASVDTVRQRVCIEGTVANMGKVAGCEVVQVYVGSPQTVLYKPERELRGFAKTGAISPGAEQRVSFDIPLSDMASYDADAHRWICEAGTYKVMVGASCTDIRQTLAFALDKAYTFSNRQH